MHIRRTRHCTAQLRKISLKSRNYGLFFLNKKWNPSHGTIKPGLIHNCNETTVLYMYICGKCRWPELYSKMGSKLPNHGWVGNVQQSGRRAATSWQEEGVFNYFFRYPSSSLRRAEQELGIARSSIQDVLRNRLHMFPYKPHIVEQLADQDYTCRNDFANRCLQIIQSGDSILNHIFYSNEYVSHVDRKVNKYNVRIWRTKNPHRQIKIAWESEKVRKWRKCNYRVRHFFESR